MKALFTLLAGLVAAGCTTDAGDIESHRMISYECGQVVVIGRIATATSELLDADGDGIAWNSHSTATIHVKRSLAGSRKGAILPVTYVSHAQLLDNADFMFVLAPNPNGRSYGLIGASLMETRPHLIQPCTPRAQSGAAEGA